MARAVEFDPPLYPKPSQHDGPCSGFLNRRVQVRLLPRAPSAAALLCSRYLDDVQRAIRAHARVRIW